MESRRNPERVQSTRRAGVPAYLGRLVLLGGIFIGATQASAEELNFEFSDWAGPALPVAMQLPEAGRETAPIVIVMHGASRDAPRYFRDWSEAARELGFIAVVPYFSKDSFPGSARYNLGHVFDTETKEQRPAAQWTFAAIEPLFDAVVERIGGEQGAYTLFGHSAGAQFVHRLLYYVPGARVKRAIAANAGWYTMPDFDVTFPYGLSGSRVPESVLPAYLGRDLVVLLGTADTVREDDTLRKTPEADRQGAHRLARGRTFFSLGAARADALGIDFGWRLQEVPGAAHSNAQMTSAAALLVK